MVDESRFVQVTTEDDDLLQANFAGIVLRARKLHDDAHLSLTHIDADEPEFVLDWNGMQKLRAFLNKVWAEWR